MNSNTLPRPFLLIGDAAFKMHGWIEDNKDDEKEDNSMLPTLLGYMQCAKKLRSAKTYTGDKLHYITFNEGRVIIATGTDLDLLHYCDLVFSKEEKYMRIMQFGNLWFRVIIPPIEILYLMEKCEITRTREDMWQNKEIWEILETHMKKYLWIRNVATAIVAKVDMALFGKHNECDRETDFFRSFYMEKCEISLELHLYPIAIDAENDIWKFTVSQNGYFYYTISTNRLRRGVAKIHRNIEDSIVEIFKKDIHLFSTLNENTCFQYLLEEFHVIFLLKVLLPKLWSYVKFDYSKQDLSTEFQSLVKMYVTHPNYNSSTMWGQLFKQFKINNYYKLLESHSHKMDELFKLAFDIVSNECEIHCTYDSDDD
jgi:hypothetical protein